MKRILTVVILTLSISSAFANRSPQGDEAAINSIRQHYGQINRSAGLYKKVKKALSGFSAEGGELVAYFHGPSVMKMIATHFGESGKASEEFYFWSGKLIFVLRTDFRYDKPFSGKVVQKTENRFYFTDDKMIRWIDENAKEVASDKPEYAEKQKEYLDSSKQLSDGARGKSSTIESNQ